MTQISEATGFELIRRLVKGAADYQADIIVTVCPMCQLNLDAFQGAMNRYFKTAYHVPVLYFTQMMGLAFGHGRGDAGDRRRAGGRAARAGEDRRRAAAACAGEPRDRPRRKRDDKSLPMPKMPSTSAAERTPHGPGAEEVRR